MLTVDLSHLGSAVPSDFLAARAGALAQVHDKLLTGTGAGGEFTGWVRLPQAYDREEFARIQDAARRIREDSEVLVVIGIGGSYLGARAVIELLTSQNYNLRPDGVQVLFAGNSLSSDALAETIDLIGERDFSVNVISK